MVSGSDQVVVRKRMPEASTLLDVSGAARCREVYGVDIYPARYRMDRELDLETLRSLMPSFSPNGVIPRDGAEAARQSMSLISEKIRAAKFDLATTYTNEFLPKK